MFIHIKAKILLIIFHCIGIVSAYAQLYKPLETSDSLKKRVDIEIFQNSVNKYLFTLKKEVNKNTYIKMNKNSILFSKDFINQIEANQFIYDKRIVGLVQCILTEICISNNLDLNAFQIMVSKNNSLNAFCLPYGTIVLHLGVFNWLQNEDQVASVLSHEISHYLLRHSIVSQVKIMEDDKIKKKTREVLNSRYGITERALELYRSILYENGEASRRNELQADSLGYLLYKNTKYNILDYKIAMSRMELFDTVKIASLKISTISQILGIEGVDLSPYLFSDVDYSRFDYYVDDKSINTSLLSSHPETRIRIDYLESLFPELNQNNSSLASELYKEISYLAIMEQAPILFYGKAYGDCLYLCMLHIQNGFQTDYHILLISKCLKEIYLARKSYTLSKYIDGLDSKILDVTYYRFLKILWELNIEEFKLLVDFYS